MVRRVDTFLDAMNAYDSRNREELERVLHLHLDRCETLIDVIASGSEEHRVWLKQAIADHFAGRRPAQPAQKRAFRT